MEFNLTQKQQKELLRIARQTIAKGCRKGLPPSIDQHNLPDIYQGDAACFVTLHKQGELRGCIGSLEAYRPLLEDVQHNAFASAFRDTRFPPVSETELSELHIEISILTPQQPMDIDSEAELLDSLRPNIDGLVIRDGGHSATFLPQVWEQLPEPEMFLKHLKLKAGLIGSYWSDSMQCLRYQCIQFEE